MSPEAVAAAPGAIRLVVDEQFGFRRVDPLPDGAETARFYESRYRDSLDEGGRAPDLARLMATDADAERERAWLAATLHADVVDAIEGAVADGAPRRALDVGAGTGDLVRSLLAAGWDAVGVEASPEIAQVGRDAGAPIEASSAADYVDRWSAAGGRPFGAVTLLNVLEHVPDPVGLLERLVRMLAPGGRLVVRVPNDFNPLQAAARELIDRDWWVTLPDHLNYFDHRSIAAVVASVGLEVVDRSTDFPMELFLLMGEDYTADPAVGRACHERRRRLELALDATTRRRLARAWVDAAIGRNSFVVGRRPR